MMKKEYKNINGEHALIMQRIDYIEDRLKKQDILFYIVLATILGMKGAEQLLH